MTNRIVPTSDYSKIFHRYVRGATLRELGDEYGVSHEAIRLILDKFNPDYARIKRKIRSSGQLQKALVALGNPGVSSQADLAEALGVSPTTIVRSLKEPGWDLVRQTLEARKPENRTEKVCSLCQELKPLEDFYVNSYNCDGRGARCRDCAKAATREWVKAANYDVTVTHKICPACQRDLPAGKFMKSRNSKSGLQTYCYKCHQRLGDGETVADIARSLGLAYRRVRRNSW